MKCVHLYTRQHENSFYELKNKGIITNKEIYVNLHMMDTAPFFKEKYSLFINYAEKRLSRPSYADYPIWTSISKYNCLKPIDNSLVYCLEVPVENVIYFDGKKWDYVLNDIYIPKDDSDAKQYEKLIRDIGVENQFSFIRGKYKTVFPEIEEKIRLSWERIFDIDVWDKFSVQANLWEIRSEWVRHIVRFGEDIFEKACDMSETFDEEGPKPVRVRK